MRLLRNKITGKITEWTQEKGRMDNLEEVKPEDFPEHLKPKPKAVATKSTAPKKKAAPKKKKAADKEPDLELPTVGGTDLGGLDGGDDS